MHWYQRLTRVANDQLGINLGKWLVLFSNGQNDEYAIQQDMGNYIASNPTEIDKDVARMTALNQFRLLTKREPSDEEIQVLERWLGFLGNPNQQIENTQMENNNEHAF